MSKKRGKRSERKRRDDEVIKIVNEVLANGAKDAAKQIRAHFRRTNSVTSTLEFATKFNYTPHRL